MQNTLPGASRHSLGPPPGRLELRGAHLFGGIFVFRSLCCFKHQSHFFAFFSVTRIPMLAQTIFVAIKNTVASTFFESVATFFLFATRCTFIWFFCCKRFVRVQISIVVHFRWYNVTRCWIFHQTILGMPFGIFFQAFFTAILHDPTLFTHFAFASHCNLSTPHSTTCMC